MDDPHGRQPGALRPIEESLEPREGVAHAHAHEMELARHVVILHGPRRPPSRGCRWVRQATADVREWRLERECAASKTGRLTVDLDQLAANAGAQYLDAV